MKLVKLSANRASFRPITFHPNGLTLIIGDGLHNDDRQEGDSNGVGKTLALRLVHFCLGGQTAPKVIVKSAADWIFTLEVLVGSTTHRIERSGDSKFIALDGRKQKPSELRSWLNVHGGFALSDESKYSFRNLFPRFARPGAADSVNPVLLDKETPAQALQRTLYLLKANDELAWKKENLREKLDTYRNELKLFNDTPSIRDAFTLGHQPAIRLKEVLSQIPKVTADMERFSVSENFRELELELDQANRGMREALEGISLKEFELNGVIGAQSQRADITKDELISLYEGLTSIFSQDVLRHLDEIDDFQRTLTTNRAERLQAEEQRLLRDIAALRTRAEDQATQRTILMEKMDGKKTLEDYASLSRELAALEEERRRIESFVQFDQTTKQKMQDLRSELVAQDTISMQYVQTEPLTDYDSAFRHLVQTLYPDATAGIVLENNDGQNRLRFNLDIVVQGQDSDGIGNARVICFDWLLFTRGRPSDLDFLWHDNRLFADLDPKPRAAWFKALLEAPELQNRQYIATLNSENFESMTAILSADEVTKLRESVVITLQGDRDENRLMGLRFG